MGPRGLPYQSLWRRGDRLCGSFDVIEYCDFGRSLLTPGDRSRGDANDSLYFLMWWPRTLLRNTPIIAYAYLAIEVIFWYRAGRSAAFPWPLLGVEGAPIQTNHLVGFLLLMMFLFVVGGLIAESAEPRIAWWPMVVKSLKAMSVLAFVAVVGVFVYTHFTTSGWQSNSVNAEYALLLLVGGYLVYDGMLRTEFLFQHLERGARLWSHEVYDDLQNRMAKCLDRFQWSGLNGIILGGFAIWFAVVVYETALTPPMVDPSNLALHAAQSIDRVLLWLTRAVIVLVAINFVVLMWYVSKLSDSSNDDPTLKYHPFHPDELGGFRDLGKFASRVNVLLILGGFYALYRIVVFDITGPIDGMAPLVAYGVVTVSWFYFTFWKLHRRMVESVRWWLAAREPPGYHSSIGAYSDQPTWEGLREAPRWPITNRRLTELISANVAPLLLGLLSLLVNQSAM